jgi:hypothetical protein
MVILAGSGLPPRMERAMQKDTTKKTDENAETAKSAADKIDELPQPPVSDIDAETVKGGTPLPPNIKPGRID